MPPSAPRPPPRDSIGACCGVKCVPCEFRIHAASEEAQRHYVEALSHHHATAGSHPRRPDWTKEIVKPGDVIREHDPSGVWAATVAMRDVYFRQRRVAQLREQEAQRLAKALCRREAVRMKLADAKARRQQLECMAGIPTAASCMKPAASPRGGAGVEAAPTPRAVRPPAPEAVFEVSSAAPPRGPKDIVLLDPTARPSSILAHMRRFRSTASPEVVTICTPRCDAVPFPVDPALRSRPSSARPFRLSS